MIKCEHAHIGAIGLVHTYCEKCLHTTQSENFWGFDEMASLEAHCIRGDDNEHRTQHERKRIIDG